MVKGMLAAVGFEVMPEGVWRELEDEEETFDMIIAGAVRRGRVLGVEVSNVFGVTRAYRLRSPIAWKGQSPKA